MKRKLFMVVMVLLLTAGAAIAADDDMMMMKGEVISGQHTECGYQIDLPGRHPGHRYGKPEST